MTTIKELKPELVWKYFYDFTQIPRPSGQEGLILNYLIEFAKTHGFDYKQDATGNVVIRKPASAGKEGSPKVALQGHVDMVCEKNSDIEFDFMKQPIDAYIDGEWIKARGTTLGADCGIGCAFMLALLVSEEVQHPALEAIFTVDEERGLTGAFGIEEDMITAKYLINLDSEDAGEVFVGCAGGKDTIATYSYTTSPIESGRIFAKISVKGLKGGHSGDDINKNLGNANILLSRFLFGYLDSVQLVSIDGGNLRNAIPRESEATIALDRAIFEKMVIDAKIYNETIQKELFASDGGVNITIDQCSKCDAKDAIDKTTTRNLIESIITAANGVLAMSQDMVDFVETSSNLASVKQADGKIEISTSQRSSVESRKEYWAMVLDTHFKKYGAEVEQSLGYPGWSPVLKSELLEVFKQQHSEVLGYEAEVKAIHAGLECGLFLAKFPHLEMISYGPTLRGVHSPDEKLKISAVEEGWRLMKGVLNKL